MSQHHPTDYGDELGLSHGGEIDRLEKLLTETKETSKRQDYLDPGRMELSIPLEQGYLRLVLHRNIMLLSKETIRD